MMCIKRQYRHEREGLTSLFNTLVSLCWNRVLNGKGPIGPSIPQKHITLPHKQSYMDEHYVEWNPLKNHFMIFVYIAKQSCSMLGQQGKVSRSFFYNGVLEEGLANISPNTSSFLSHHDIIKISSHQLSGLILPPLAPKISLIFPCQNHGFSISGHLEKNIPLACWGAKMSSNCQKSTPWKAE